MSSSDGKPSFAGNSLPLNVNPICIDDIGEETTRRVAFQPCFEPISSIHSSDVSLKPQADQLKAQTSPGISGNICRSQRTNGIWRLRSAPSLPEYYLLERTAVFVPNVSPSEISARVSDTLRERSIEVVYEDDKAKAKCRTADSVEFRVRLYRGRGGFDHGIIVEVQRRFGASNTFHADTLAILDAAEGKVPSPPSLNGSSLPLVDFDDEQIDGSSSISMVSKLFSHDGYDSHYLALQTLCSLTSAAKMGITAARAVSKELLRRNSDYDAVDKVLSLIVAQKCGDDAFNLRSLAFLAVANAFQTLNGEAPTFLKAQLRPVLIAELRHANSNPGNAAQAARILEFYLPEDTGSDIYDALSCALEAGASRHASLERQAQVCLAKLK